MGAATTCSLARRAGAPAPEPGDVAAAGAAIAGGGAITGACIIGCRCVNMPLAGMRLMRTASSPSLISISAIPDSSSSSISFLTLRISKMVSSINFQTRWKARALTGGDPRGRSLHRQLVTQRPQADDAAHGDVREIRVVSEFLPREGVRQVQFDERQLHSEQRVAQRYAGVGEAPGVEDCEADAVGLGGLHAIDELVLGVALERDHFMAETGGGVPGALFDGGQGVGTVNFRFALPQQIQVRAIK